MGAGLRSPQEGDPTSKFVAEGAAQAAAPAKFSSILSLLGGGTDHTGSELLKKSALAAPTSLKPAAATVFRVELLSIDFLERKRWSLSKRKEDEGTRVGKVSCRATIAAGRLHYLS